MTRESIQWELELLEAGWKPTAAHPNSPTWSTPDGKMIYPGPGYAHSVMKQLKGDLNVIQP